MKIKAKYRPELCASNDVTRYHLNQPHFDAKKSVIVATNGHVMAIVPCEPDAADTSGFVPAEALKVARKLDVPIALNGDARLPDGQAWPRAHADFPQWASVLPTYDDKKTVRVAFNVDYLVAIAKAIGADKHDSGKKRSPIVNLTIEINRSKETDSPITVRVTGDDDAYGILMPCRLG